MADFFNNKRSKSTMTKRLLKIVLISTQLHYIGELIHDNGKNFSVHFVPLLPFFLFKVNLSWHFLPAESTKKGIGREYRNEVC